MCDTDRGTVADMAASSISALTAAIDPGPTRKIHADQLSHSAPHHRTPRDSGRTARFHREDPTRWPRRWHHRRSDPPIRCYDETSPPAYAGAARGPPRAAPAGSGHRRGSGYAMGARPAAPAGQRSASRPILSGQHGGAPHRAGRTDGAAGRLPTCCEEASSRTDGRPLPLAYGSQMCHGGGRCTPLVPLSSGSQDEIIRTPQQLYRAFGSAENVAKNRHDRDDNK